MTFTINDMDYTFFPATMDGMPVIGFRHVQNGESFCEWSAEASMPTNEEEAETMLTQCGWEIVDAQADFYESERCRMRASLKLLNRPLAPSQLRDALVGMLTLYDSATRVYRLQYHRVAADDTTFYVSEWETNQVGQGPFDLAGRRLRVWEVVPDDALLEWLTGDDQTLLGWSDVAASLYRAAQQNFHGPFPVCPEERADA